MVLHVSRDVIDLTGSSVNSIGSQMVTLQAVYSQTFLS